MFSNKTKKSPNQVTLKKTMTTTSASTKTKMMMMMWLVLKLWPYSLSSSSSCHFFWGRIQFHHLARSSLFCSKSNTKKKLQKFSENSFEMEWDRERERERERERIVVRDFDFEIGAASSTYRDVTWVVNSAWQDWTIFTKFSATNCITKVAQLSGHSFGFFKVQLLKYNLFVEHFGYFWGNWATVNFTIWSH